MPRVCPDADGGRARQMHNINTCWITGADPGFEKGSIHKSSPNPSPIFGGPAGASTDTLTFQPG